MSRDITIAELETLKSRFRAADCAVTDLNGKSFEIARRDIPVRTHVLVTPFYLQLGTYIVAAPRGFLRGGASEVHTFLNAINVRAKLVKFTMESDQPDAARGGWNILASVQLVTGVIGGDYDAAALKNLTTLWYQDIAELIASPSGFELRAMFSDV